MTIKITKCIGDLFDGRPTKGHCLTIEIGRFNLDIAWGRAA